MKAVPPPQVLIRHLLENPNAITVASFAIAALFLGISGWFIHRNLRHNEPGLRAPLTLPFALIISAAGLFGANRLPAPFAMVAGISVCALAGLLFYYAHHRRYVRDPAGKIVADRWQVVLAFAGFRWTRDKANRHFFFSGDTGSGKTSGMNGLLAALVRRNPTLGGVIMANKGDEWFYLEWLAKKCGREKGIIRLRPRLVGETDAPLHRLNVTGDDRFPFTARARMLVDTAAALNPKDEKSFFKMKGAAHIGRAFELLADTGRPVTATNAYDLLTSESELKAALDQLTKVESTLRRARLAETFEQTYINHQYRRPRVPRTRFPQAYLNFTWWVNRKNAQGRNIFQGGFLGLDNIGVFDRSAPLPTGGHLNQADGTSWMAMYSLIRAISQHHRDHPYEFHSGEIHMGVSYEPAESSSGLFGGNSNWRGPIWIPSIISSSSRCKSFTTTTATISKSSAPPARATLLRSPRSPPNSRGGSRRFSLRMKPGSAPCLKYHAKLAGDPHFKDLVLFHEYFHGETGRGVGASHQTGWTGLVPKLLQPRAADEIHAASQS